MSGFSEEGNKSSTIRCFPVFDKRTCVSRAFYTSFYVAIGALFPYLPVYFKQLKLSSHQNGILIGIRPLIQFCATPLWGACADKFHKSKTILLISVLGWLVSNFLLLLVPVNKDPMLCDFYDMNYEDGFSSSSNPSTLNDFVRGRNVTLKHFCSRISPYLESMEPFFLPTLRDFQEACGERLRSSVLSTNIKEEPRFPIFNLTSVNYQSFEDNTGNSDHNSKHVSCDSSQFIYLLTVTVLGTIIAAPAQALADTATLQSLQGETHKYGRVRLWGSLGWGVGGFSVGAAISSNEAKNYCGEVVIDYSPCFYVYAAAMSVALICGTQFEFDQSQGPNDKGSSDEAENLKTDGIIEALNIFRNPQFCFVIFIAFFCGSATGFIETFLFWYLHELGGDQLLFSVVNGLNCAAEVCAFLVSDKFLHLFGHINVIYLALFCYSIRFVYFYIIENPWYVLPAELLQGITTAAFWSSCVSYVGLHPGASNTVQSILNGVYMGLGFATGGLIGGLLAQVIGMKLAFLLYAFASFCFIIPFVLVNTFGKK
ncbi:Major facilitator superfamily domain-containing protein 6 [Acropora cervicornis]|uniref:Major facilitator superfamily domain-containing protein 6 n=1 Tax=Acropora cervicornis TaxID=6130 RepID=A0AAD9V5Z3_ACRCE|nr:Major facilitator superfamily domain-containing protein 6 [Acropora cervicornis]